ncbi:MAG TPA: cupin domain-containing protein [Casimicrobiaceae bacterium]
MSKSRVRSRKPIVLAPGDGRAYPMGRISAVFKADEKETESRYSVSEWWLEARTGGPGPHSHAEDDLFYVIEGVMSIRVDDEWIDCPKGTFVLVPGGVIHDFENRTDIRAGFLNFSSPGPFEPEMRGIAEWFIQNAPKATSR